jgi:hypothetical protein
VNSELDAEPFFMGGLDLNWVFPRNPNPEKTFSMIVFPGFSLWASPWVCFRKEWTWKVPLGIDGA